MQFIRSLPLLSRACALALSGLIAVAAVAPAHAVPAAKAGKVARSTPKEARAMLDKAVAYLGQHFPAKALAAFNDPRGEFVRGDVYVFVVGLDGVMHANGGASEGLVGLNVTDLRDAAGKSLIREILDTARTAGAGSIDYVWLNRLSNRVESKTTQFRRVGDYVVAVGSYTPRSSAEQAKALLEQAVGEIGKVGADAAFGAFNARHGRFVHDDLYVFVVGLDDTRFYAMGATPELVGNDAGDLRDAAGKPIIREMARLAKERESGAYEYVWRNPANNKVENKHSLIQRVGGYLVGVGYYTK